MVWPIICGNAMACGQVSQCTGSLQLGVLRLGFLQDGDVGVGVFPLGEEVLVVGASFGGVARKSKASGKAEPSQGDIGRGPESGFVIENLLELGHRLRALFGLEISEAAQADRHASRYVAELV